MKRQKRIALATSLITAILMAACGTKNTPTPSGLPDPINSNTSAPADITVTALPTLLAATSPAPAPVQVVNQGDLHLRNGDWDAAIAAYQQVLASPSATAPELAASQIGLAQAFLRRGDFASAKATLDGFVTQFGSDARIAQGYFLRGEARLGLSDWTGAIEDYNTYLTMRPGLIDSYVYERIGDAYLAVGQSDQAITAYEVAITSDRYFVGSLLLREKVASIHRTLGNADAAIAQYQAILAVAQNPAYRAAIDSYIAQSLLEVGRTDEANIQYEAVFMTYPESFEAITALRALLDAEIPVDQYQRGIVNYNQGQYEIALEAFYNHLAATPIGDYTPDVYLYIARSYRQIGNPDAALSELQSMIDFFDFTDGTEYADGWLEMADTYAELENYPQAFSTYDNFVLNYPTLAQAPDALYQAALLADTLGDTQRAIAYYQRLANEYPTDERAPDALFYAALDAYRIADYTTATNLFTQTVTMAGNDQVSRSNFWIGKTHQAAGDAESAATAYQSAVAAAGGRYYGLRAEDIATSSAPFAPAGAPNIPADWNEGRAEAEQWMIATFALTETAPLAERLRADLATDPRMLRAKELWDLGLLVEARQHYEDIRTSYQDDALAMYQLAIYFREIGLYRGSVLSAWRVMQLAEVDALSAPTFLARLRFPLYYSDIVLPYAEQYQLDPLWVYALIWQESIFEGFAVSSAAAQGLMQVWPPTGEDIAERIEWPNYRPSDLQRPYVNVAFGTWLLRDELDRFSGNQYAALSAYNAGPGNTARWVERSMGDPDLFVESISLSEPKTYVQRIYEHFEVYRALYGNPTN